MQNAFSVSDLMEISAGPPVPTLTSLPWPLQPRCAALPAPAKVGAPAPLWAPAGAAPGRGSRHWKGRPLRAPRVRCLPFSPKPHLDSPTPAARASGNGQKGHQEGDRAPGRGGGGGGPFRGEVRTPPERQLPRPGPSTATMGKGSSDELIRAANSKVGGFGF